MPDYYLCEARTLKAVAGPFESPYEVAALVDAQDDPTQYGTSSRYELAKCGKYPRNKRGDAALLCDVMESGKYKVRHLDYYASVACKNCGNTIKRSMYRGWFHKGYDEHGALEPPMNIKTWEICNKPEPAAA